MSASLGGPAAPPVRVELATWRPVHVVDVDGWAVGVSGGFTRRANSAAALVGVADVEGTLDQVEGVYRAAGLPAVVRVCDATLPVGLDRVLEERGYAVAARTLVLTREERAAGEVVDGRVLGGVPSGGGALDGALRLRSSDQPDEAWLRGWLEVKTSEAVDLALARSVVAGAPATYLTASDDDGDVGVVRVAVSDGWAAISCLMVAPRARRRGIAALLTEAAASHGVRLGAERSFLQVEQSNLAARALYQRCGFAEAGGYHYREKRILSHDPRRARPSSP